MHRIDTPVTVIVALKGKFRNAHIRTLKTLEECTNANAYSLRIGGSGVSSEVRRYVETMHNVEACLLDETDDPAMTEDRLMRLLAHQPELKTSWVAFVYGGTYFSGDWLTDAAKALGRNHTLLSVIGRTETRDCSKLHTGRLQQMAWYSAAERNARAVKTCRPGFALLPVDMKLLFDWPAKKDELLGSQELNLGLSARHTGSDVIEIGASIVVGQAPVRIGSASEANND